jgi:hypothetical protein
MEDQIWDLIEGLHSRVCFLETIWNARLPPEEGRAAATLESQGYQVILRIKDRQVINSYNDENFSEAFIAAVQQTKNSKANVWVQPDLQEQYKTKTVFIHPKVSSKKTNGGDDVAMYDNSWYVIAKVQIQRMDEKQIWAIWKVHKVESESKQSKSQLELEKLLSLRGNQKVLSLFPMFICALSFHSVNSFTLENSEQIWNKFEGLVWQQLVNIDSVNPGFYTQYIVLLTKLHSAGYIHGNMSWKKFMYLTVAEQESTGAAKKATSSNQEQILKMIDMKNISPLHLDIQADQKWFTTVWDQLKDEDPRNTEDNKMRFMASFVMILFDLNKLALNGNPLINVEDWCIDQRKRKEWKSVYYQINTEIFNRKERENNHDCLCHFIPFVDDDFANNWTLGKITQSLEKYPNFQNFILSLSMKDVSDLYFQIFVDMHTKATSVALETFKREFQNVFKELYTEGAETHRATGGAEEGAARGNEGEGAAEGARKPHNEDEYADI